MADVATITPANEAPTKKPRGRRAPLKELSANEQSGGKKSDSISAILSPKKSKPARKTKAPAVAAPAASESSFADELEELQAKLNQLRLEKEKAEETVREKDALLKKKDEERDKLQKELKEVQKAKEFKPHLSFPVLHSVKDKEDEKKVIKKKPSPAYVLWCKDQWNEVKKENPDAEFKDISIILGTRWKSVSAEEKKPYEEKYQRDKEAYLQVVGQERREHEAMKLLEEEKMQKTAMDLLEQYLHFKQESEKDVKKTKREKDPHRPKRPLSAFFIFSEERRSALLQENKSILEIAKIMGEEWKNMDSDRKFRYIEMAKKEKEAYSQKMATYNCQKAEEAYTQKKEEEEQKKVMRQEALRLLKKKEKTDDIIKKAKETQKKKKDLKVSDPNKPKKPPTSYILFSKEARSNLLKERPGIDNSTLNALISVKWKDLSEEERQVWSEKAAGMMELYKKEMKEYTDQAAEAEKNNQASV